MEAKSNHRPLIIAVAVLALVALACTCSSFSFNLGGGGASYPNAFDGGDGYDTTLLETIQIGETREATLDSLLEAHNWQFQGTAGQTVTIRVNAIGDTDPRAKLIDPSGNVIAEDDDGGGGYDSLIVATLPVDGTYTVRVDVFTTGRYTITIE